MWQFTIRQYVACLTLIPLLIMAVVLEAYFLSNRFADLDRDVLEHGKLISRQLATSSEYGVFSNNQTFLNDIAQGVLQQPDVRAVAILNAASYVLIETGGFSFPSTNSKDDGARARPEQPGTAPQLRASSVNDVVNLHTPVRKSGGSLWLYQPIISAQVQLDDLDGVQAAHQVGGVILQMSLSRTSKLKSQMFWLTVISTALFLLVSIYLIYRAGRSITSPICKLSDAVHMIGKGHLEMRVTVPTRIAELNNLASGINAMAAELQQKGKVLQQQIEETTRIAAIAFESHEGMIVADTSGVILRVNNAFTKITGYLPEDAIGQSVRMLKSGRHDANFYNAMWKTIKQTGTWQGEILNARKNGEIYPAWLAITAVERGDGVVINYVATLSDITSRKAAENEIKNLAFYDTLTQLPNRRMLLDRLNLAIATSKRNGRYGALMFLDLDNFKPLNDKHGHAVGDFLLIEAARRISSCVRDVDTVARFGGDEFVVMLNELDASKSGAAAQASIIAEKIRTVLAEPYDLAIPQQGGAASTMEKHDCTSSIGVALFADTDTSLEDVLKWADMAMYKAKRDGRNLIRFNE